MKSNLKKALSSVISAAMLASSLIIPMTANAADSDVMKFDFGSADNVAEGYTAVPADTSFTANGSYGFLGIGEKDYLLTDRMDSFSMQQGQIITLANGAKTTVATANDDYVTAEPEDNPLGGKNPIRFTTKAENGAYYKVKVTVTGADQTKDANITLMSEKRHLITTNEPLAAGESKTFEYSVDVQTIYYEKSEPKGNFVDDTISVVVTGDNAALASVEIEKQETPGKTLWVLGDSTVCDQSAPIPYFGLQDYAGVGQALQKYLPSDIALSNHGEGGLDATDNSHFNNVKNNIKAGDYMFVEYGHNHKTDGPEGYLAALPKYYEAAHAKGANLIIVGPIDRHNSSQYDSTTNTWSSTLSGFSDAGKAYVESKIAEGATDIAFVDLNEPWLRFLESVTETTRTASTSNFYFTYSTAGLADGTHINDAGMDQASNIFFQAAKKTVDENVAVQSDVLRGLVEGMSDRVPYTVPDEIISAGHAPNSFYPNQWVTLVTELPTTIKNIEFDENGSPKTMDIKVKSSTLPTYGRGIIVIYNADGSLKGVVFAKDQLDNSTGAGTQTVSFDTDLTYNKDAGDTIKAYVWGFKDEEGYPLTMVPFAPTWEPIDVDHLLITKTGGDANNIDDIETFDDGITEVGDSITGKNGWGFVGSAATNEQSFGKDDDGTTFVKLFSDGYKGETGNSGSFFFQKQLATSENSGQIIMDFDVRYRSGNAVIGLFGGLPSGYPAAVDAIKIDTGKVTLGTQEVGNINADKWQHIRYILDMDFGTVSVALNGGAPVTFDVDGFKQNATETTPAAITHIGFVMGDPRAMDYDVANLMVGKIKVAPLINRTLTVGVLDKCKDMGTASGTGEFTMNSIVTATAEANEGYEFDSWVDENGNPLSYAATYDLRLHTDVNAYAVFKVKEVDNIIYLLKEQFSTLTTATLASNGWVSANAQASMEVVADSTDGIGNYLKYGANSNSRGAVKAFDGTLLGSASADNKLVYSMNIKFNTPSTDPNELAIHGGNITYNSGNQNYGATGGRILYFEQTSSGAVTFNGAETTVPANTWATLTATIDFTNHTVDATITSLDGQTTYYTGQTTSEDTAATEIKGMYFKFGKSTGGVISMDNIKVYTAEQLNN